LDRSAQQIIAELIELDASARRQCLRYLLYAVVAEAWRRLSGDAQSSGIALVPMIAS
jgi:hypothetical protein